MRAFCSPVVNCLSMLFAGMCCFAFTLLFPSCSTALPVEHVIQPEQEGVRVSYSIVCAIHGDGEYLYHDSNGIEHNADEEALAGAKIVAEQNPHAEMFIFHQKPRQHILFLFPLHDGEFFFYRNGRLVAHELYWRDQEQSHFASEVELYRRFHTDNRGETASMFLYYGHDIPEFDGAGYDASYPQRSFTVLDFANGLREFMRDSTRFDLIVLSTCFGGTPYTIGTLGSSAKYIVASPDNLHLSYFDFHSLEGLDLSMRDGAIHTFAIQFARRTFDRLTRNLQTAVSVAVYDVDRVQEFLGSVAGAYELTLLSLMEKGQTAERCDCAELTAYLLPTMSDGVEVFYQSASFGRSKQKQNHSGWECWNVGK